MRRIMKAGIGILIVATVLLVFFAASPASETVDVNLQLHPIVQDKTGEPKKYPLNPIDAIKLTTNDCSNDVYGICAKGRAKVTVHFEDGSMKILTENSLRLFTVAVEDKVASKFVYEIEMRITHKKDIDYFKLTFLTAGLYIASPDNSISAVKVREFSYNDVELETGKYVKVLEFEITAYEIETTIRNQVDAHLYYRNPIGNPSLQFYTKATLQLNDYPDQYRIGALGPIFAFKVLEEIDDPRPADIQIIGHGNFRI